MSATCTQCVFFNPDAPAESPDPMNPTPAIYYAGEGECRIKAPGVDGFPKVASTDWCGEIIVRR